MSVQENLGYKLKKFKGINGLVADEMLELIKDGKTSSLDLKGIKEPAMIVTS